LRKEVDSFRRWVYARSVMPEKVTLETIAREAGVSTSTVSRVLNQPGLVNSETRRDVYAALDKHGYIPQADSRAVQERKHVIGVAIHDFHLSVFADLLRAVEDELTNTPYDALIINMRGERDAYRFFREHTEYRRKIDALLAFSVDLSSAGAQFLESLNLPVVLLQARCRHAKSISTNNFLGGHDAAGHLLSRGYRRIAFVGWDRREDQRLRGRYAGYRNALEEHELQPEEELAEFDQLSVDGGYEATARLFQRVRPDSVFYACDSMAIGGLRYFREHRIGVPEEVGVMGFDDIEAASAVGLTTMRQFIETKARMAVDHLMGRLEGEIRETDHEEVSISPKLVVRATT